MATIRRTVEVAAPAERVWAIVRDVGAAHTHLFPTVLRDVRLEDGARVATFANGRVVRELIVTVDDVDRRFVYAAVGGSATHHNSSLQVVPTGDASCRIVWMTDLLPDAIEPAIRQLVDLGVADMRRALAQL
jgi:hypothetical protein